RPPRLLDRSASFFDQLTEGSEHFASEEARGTVAIHGRDRGIIGAERYGLDVPARSHEHRQDPARDHVPDPDISVAAGRGDELAIRADRRVYRLPSHTGRVIRHARV